MLKPFRNFKSIDQEAGKATNFQFCLGSIKVQMWKVIIARVIIKTVGTWGSI